MINRKTFCKSGPRSSERITTRCLSNPGYVKRSVVPGAARVRFPSLRVKGKGKVFPYSLPSVGPGADPGVQAVSPQVT